MTEQTISVSTMAGSPEEVKAMADKLEAMMAARMAVGIGETAVRMTLDYDSLDSDTRAYMQELDAELDVVLKRSSKEIGNILLRAKAILPHGMFQSWHFSKGISQNMAWRCMQVAQGKELKSSILDDLPAIQEPRPEYQPPVYTPPPSIQSPTLTEREASLAGYRGYERWQEAQTWEEKRQEVQIERRDAHVMRVMGSSESPEWYTPQEIVRLSIELLGEIDLDPCSNSHETPNVPARTLYTKEDDGLSQTWKGKVYLNPPYGSEISKWVDKLVDAYNNEQVEEALTLLPGRIDTAWFQPLYDFPMCNVRGRVQYENSPYSAPFPCVIVYLGEREADFIRVFGSKGPIMRRIG